MAQYRVKPGVRFGASDQHAPGDIVDLSEQEAAGFADKLALVREPATPPRLPEALTPISEAQGSLPPAIEAALLEAGLATVEQVRATSDAGLLALPGIGRAALKKIREATR